MRRIFNTITIASLLLSVAAALMWARSRTTWETLFVRTGRLFWKIDSSLGTLTIDQFDGWPNPPGYHYRVSPPDPSQSVTPVFVLRTGGARRTEWRRGEFAGASGTVCIALKPNGLVDWDSPALPVLESFMSASLSLSPPILFWSVTGPYWSLVLAFAVLPVARAAAIAGRAAAKRVCRAVGHCPRCGYDLRESPVRCPECGAAVVQDLHADWNPG